MEADGRYFDGRSALERMVRATLTEDGVEIRDPTAVETWPYALIRRERRDGLSYLQRTDATARLSVSDPAFLAALAERCPRLDRHGGGKRRAATIAAGATAVAALAIGAVQYLPQIGARLLPVAWEEQLGDQVLDIAGFVFSGAREAKFCDAANGTRALDGLVARLADGLDTPYRFKVRVLDTKRVNAFAAPGGRIVVLSGLIAAAASPEELAGVLAHEIGHVVHRHPTEGMLRRLSEGQLLSFATGNAAGGSAISAIADTMIGASHSRSAEAEADRAALDLLDRSRISPVGFAAFFERLIAKGDDSKGSLLASHPADATRARLARERAATLVTVRPAMTADEWKAVKAMCGA